MRRALLFVILLGLPGSVRAQEVQETPAAQRAGAAAAAFLKTGSVAGEVRLFLGGWAGLVLGDHFVLGGGGMSLTSDVGLSGSGTPTGFHLGAGYGGVFLKYWTPFSHGFSGEGSILLGAGHAEVEDRVTGEEVGAENFLVMEPEATLFFNVFRQLFLGASGGYRFTSGLDKLPRVSPDDLQSFTATLSLRLGGH
jgi:hypothetical protein